MTGLAYLVPRFLIRHLRKNRFRTIAVIFGIAMGAAVFGSVRVSIDSATDSFRSSIDRITGTAEFHVIRPGGVVPNRVMARLAKLTEVEVASPFLSRYVLAQDTEDPFLLVGLDPFSDTGIRDWDAKMGERIGDLVARPDTLMLADGLFRELGRPETLEIQVGRGRRSMRVVGVLAGEFGVAEGGRLAICDVATFQEISGNPAGVDRIDIRIRGSRKAAEAAIGKVLPEFVVLQPASRERQAGLGLIRAYRMNLTVLSFVSLFVGMFLVYSVVALNAASRKREVATLRALGASRKTIFALFIGDGILLGGMGWLLSIPLGIVGIAVLRDGIRKTVDLLFASTPETAFFIQPAELFISIGVTLAVSALAAMRPAIEAMDVRPGIVFSESEHFVPERRQRHQFGRYGLICLGGVPIFAFWPAWQGISIGGYVATFLLFSGVSFLVPGFLRKTGRPVSAFLAKLFGSTAFIAGRYLRNAGIRTAVSTGALITSVALFVALTIMVTSFRETVRVWVHQTVSGDLFIRPKMAELNRHRDPLPEDVFRDAASHAGFDSVAYRRIPFRIGDRDFDLEAMDMEAFFAHGEFLWVKGDPGDRKRLLTETVMLASEIAANRYDLEIGDRVAVPTGNRPVSFEVIGIVRDYRTKGAALFCDRMVMERFSGVSILSGVRLFATGPPEAGSGIRTHRSHLISKHGDRIDVVVGTRLRETVLKIFDDTFAVTFILLGIALAVASLGIATTMTIRVLERYREIHTLRALGGSIRQIRSVIRWEAGLLVLAGMLLGLASGLVLAVLLMDVINRQSFGWTFIKSFETGDLLPGLVLIVVAGILAAQPAIRVVFRNPSAHVLRER